MKLINNIKNSAALILVAGLLFASCNKAPEAPVPNVIPPNPASGISLSATITANADDSLFNRLVIRTGSQALLNNTLNRYTVYVPNNAAMRNFVNAASGGAIPVASPDAVHSNFLNSTLPIASAGGIVQYNISPQVVTSATITSTFPNFAYPSIINPAPTASAFASLDNYPSKRANGAWLNNIPLVPGIDVAAANGVIHHTAAVSTPPSVMLWSRIDVDADMTYLKSAIRRADSAIRFTPVSAGGYGFAAGDYTTPAPAGLNSASLESVLSNFGPNLTVFAPTNAAFQATLYAAVYPAVYNLIYQQAYALAIGGGATPAQAAVIATNAATTNAPAQTTALVSTPAVFTNPLLFGGLTAQTVKGIVVYHVLGDRAFSVNCPTTTTSVPTLLNSAIPTHPGIGITATFTGPSVSGITVKGVGNASAFPVSINPTPNPNGTSDQHFVNGILHKLNGVLLPQ